MMPDPSDHGDNVATGECGEQRLVGPRGRSRSEVGMRAARLIMISSMALAVSCSSGGPSYEEVAAELQKDVQRLEAHDVFKNPEKKLRILQRADVDIPCGRNRFLRVLRATADYERADESLVAHLDRAENLMENALARDLGYELDYDASQSDAEDGRFITGEKETFGIKVTVYIASEAPTWRIRAITPCMER